MTAARYTLAILLGGLWGNIALSADTGNDSSLPNDIQGLKQDVLQLNKELTVLENELLYPSSQSALFVSIDLGSTVRIVDINLVLDGRNVGYHFYTDQEFAALTKGGLHRLFNGNLITGKHELKTVITGYDPKGKSFQRVVAYNFVKGGDRKFVELRISDDANKSQPEFQFRDWDVKQ